MKRAKAFIETRKHHLAEIAEDYVEIISDLIQAKGDVRVNDIAEQLGVSHVTVIRTLQRLETKGLLTASPIVLSKSGSKLAASCKARHQFLLEYLNKLGVPEEVAQIDVEGIEHHISPATLEAFKKHLDCI